MDEVETHGGTRGWIPTQYLERAAGGLLINDMRQESSRSGESATALSVN